MKSNLLENMKLLAAQPTLRLPKGSFAA
jgi:hypothetical protein